MLVAEFSSIEELDLRPKPSSLLEATPPRVVYALSTAWPLLCTADCILGWLTWTSKDSYESVMMVMIFVAIWKYFETLVRHWLPTLFAISLVILLYSQQGKSDEPPTLDDIVVKLEQSGKKFRKYISPLESAKLSGQEMVKFMLATLFLSPIYIAVTHFYLTPRKIILVVGLLLLTWHSLWFRVARSMAWRFAIVRIMLFFITGVDRTSAPKDKKASRLGNEKQLKKSLSQQSLRESTKVTFTFVVYENQRYWFGIGWTSNMIPQERAAWTDSSLNEVQSIDAFVLPDAEGTDMVWQWVDMNWKLDLTNGDFLPCKQAETLKAHPDYDEGYVYTNSIWTSPSNIYGYSKCTRRRRWVRTAALVPAKNKNA